MKIQRPVKARRNIARWSLVATLIALGANTAACDVDNSNPSPDTTAPSPRTIIEMRGSAKVLDDEFASSPEVLEFRIEESRTFDQQSPRHRILDFRECVGDEVVARLDLEGTLTPAGTIEVADSAELFEQTTCHPSDRVDSKPVEFSVPPDSRTHHAIDLEGKGGDQAKVDLTISSRRGG